MKKMIALAATCLAALMFGLEISSVPIILPTLSRELAANFIDMQWVMNAYTIACTTILMAAGTAADRFGRRLVFILSMGLFALASLICGLEQDISTLIVSRAAQGLGGGAMLICLIAILSHRFSEPAERSRAFGVWGIVFGMGLGLGPVVGGLIAALIGWRWVFLVHVPIAVLTLALTLATIRESRDPHAKALDGGGIIFLSATILALVICLTEGPQLGFTNPSIAGLAGAAAVSFLVFIYIENRTASPMFDFSIFRIRRFTGAIMGSVGLNFSFWPLMIYLPTYFQNGLGYSSDMAGLVLLAYTLPVLGFPPIGEHLALHFGARVVIPGGLFLIGFGFFLMAGGSTSAQASWITLLPGCLLAGTGVGIANSPVTNTLTSAVPPGRAGMASGLDMTARLVTLAINIALMGAILLEGIQSSLSSSLRGQFDTQHVQALAERLAAGSSVGTDPGIAPERFGQMLHLALQNGFAAIAIYGGVGAGVVGVLSFIAFRESARIARPSPKIASKTPC